MVVDVKHAALYLVDVARHEGAARGRVQVNLEAKRTLLGDGELAPLQLRNTSHAARQNTNIMSRQADKAWQGETAGGVTNNGKTFTSYP